MQYENKILNFHIYLYFPSNIFKKFKNIKIKGLTYYILTCIISLVFTRNKSKHTIQYARVAQWWSTSLPRRGPRVRSPSRAFFFTFLGVFCVCTYIWKILKLKHFPKKLIPYIKIGY